MEAGTASAGSTAPSAPAGWYANPEGPGERYWSGHEWGPVRPESIGRSEESATSPAPSVVADQAQSWWVAAIASVAMIIGGFGPWATALGFVSVNGTQGDGWLVIAAGVAGLLLLWAEARSRQGGGLLLAAGLAGAGGAAVAIYYLAQIESAQGELFGEDVDLIDPAWGLYASILGGATLVVAAFVLHRARSSKGGAR
jgi:hypothetical protein